MDKPSVAKDILIDIRDDYKLIEKTGLDIGSSYHYNLGKAYLDLGLNNKAIENLLSFTNLFNQLVEEKSGNEFHLWIATGKRMAGKSLLAIAYAKKDRISDAINELNDWLKINPSDETAIQFIKDLEGLK